jgi:hypothetical protein
MERRKHGKLIRFQREMEHMRIDAVLRKKMVLPVVKWYQEDRITVSDIQRNKKIKNKKITKKTI